MPRTSNPVLTKRVSLVAGLLSGALLAGSFAPATAQDREVPDMAARPRVPIYDPGQPVQRKVLKNGVVLLVQEQRTTEKVAASLTLRMGTLYEDAATSGLSQVLMRALTKGTAQHGPVELQLQLLANKVTVESGSSADYGQVAVETVRESAERALELLADIALAPTFPDTSVESARSAFMSQAAMDVESPLQGTYSMFLAAMYRGTPFARPPHGSIQALAECRRSDLQALHKRLFVGGNMVVAAVGNLDGDRIMAHLERLFATAPAGAPPAAEPDPGPPGTDTLVVAERPYLAQSLVYGYPAPGYAHPDYAAFMILDSYLRSGDRSPITFWLPERRQAAGVGVMYPPYPRRSSLAVHLGAVPAKFKAARDTVAAVMGRLRDVELDEGEWGVQLKRVQNGFFVKQNDPLVRARNYGRWESQGVTLEFPVQFETALLKLTPQDVRDAAARWFTNAVEATIKPAQRKSSP